MDLRSDRSRDWRGRPIEAKANNLDVSPKLQGFLEQAPLVISAEASSAFFEVFGFTYAKLYRTQSAFRAVVDFLSRNIAQCKVRVLHEDESGARLPEPDHPVQKLLDHPQPRVPRSRLMRQVIADKAIYDVAAVLKVRERFDPTPNAQNRIVNRGTVTDLVRLPVPLVEIWQGSLTSPIEFRVTSGRDQFLIPVEDVIWMPGYSPTSNQSGVPPAETLRQILAEEWAAGKDRENFWKRGIHLNSVFVQDANSQGLTPDQGKEFKAEWQNRFGGVGASHAGETPLLPPAVDIKPLAINSGDMEYLATRNLAREECCRAYGIQPQLLGITPANFASMDMFHQMLYMDTLAPWMIGTQEDLEEQLLREFESEDSGYYLDFNINAKMMGSFMDQATIGQKAVGGPWMLADEFREKFQGMPPLGGDAAELITPTNVVRGGGPQANPQDAQNQFTAPPVPAKSLQPEQLELSLDATHLRVKKVLRNAEGKIDGIVESVEPVTVEVNNYVEPTSVPAPAVTVEAPFVNVDPPDVHITLPEHPVPVVNVAAARAPEVNVTVPESHIDVHVPEQRSEITVEGPTVNLPEPKVDVAVTVPRSEPVIEVKVPAVEAPHIDVHVPAQEAPVVNLPEPRVDVSVEPPNVVVNVPEPAKRRVSKRVVRDAKQRIVGLEETEE